VSTSHILKGSVQFLAGIELAFGNVADVHSVMFYLQMSLYFCLLHQPLDLDWYAHRFDRCKIKAPTPSLLPADKMLLKYSIYTYLCPDLPSSVSCGPTT
jgi:hypothetical protein